MGEGYVLDFSNASYTSFFNELNIDIYDSTQYPGFGDSKANRMRALWKHGSTIDISNTLKLLADYIESKKLSTDTWSKGAFSEITAKQLNKIREIADNLLLSSQTARHDNIAIIPPPITTAATISANKIEIEIHEDIYTHITQYIKADDYFHAVEESYKIVRQKLNDKTGKEKASDIFNWDGQNPQYWEQLFGKSTSESQSEKDFFRGIGYLNLGIQFLRNEKAHTLAAPIEKNLALHYISLASFAYDLITRYISSKSIRAIEDIIYDYRHSFATNSAFYGAFKHGKWLRDLELPAEITTPLCKSLRTKWMDEVDFTISWTHSNVMLMRLELVIEEISQSDIDSLLSLPTKDSRNNDQLAGMEEFLEFIKLRYPERLSPIAHKWIIEHGRI